VPWKRIVGLPQFALARAGLPQFAFGASRLAAFAFGASRLAAFAFGAIRVATVSCLPGFQESLLPQNLDEQNRNGGGRDPRDARGLSDRTGTHPSEFLDRLV
jgi:hypothetical protein